MSSCSKPCVEGSSISPWPPMGTVTLWQPVALSSAQTSASACSVPPASKCSYSTLSHCHSVDIWKERGRMGWERTHGLFTPFSAENDGLKPCKANQSHIYFSKGEGGGGESFPERTWP